MASTRDATRSSSPRALGVSNRLLQAVALAALLLVTVLVQLPSYFSTVLYARGISSIEKMEHMFATKTIYWDQRSGSSGSNEASELKAMMIFPTFSFAVDRQPLREELELIQTQIVARHGIRYPTGKNIQSIQALVERLRPFENALPTWLRNYTLPYNLSVKGELAVPGERELHDLAARNLASSGYSSPVMYSKKKYRVMHSQVARARDSAIACDSFAHSYFANPEDVDYITHPKKQDILLRFFDACARYQREVKHNQTALAQMHEYEESAIMTKIAQSLKRSLGLESKPIKFSAEDLMTVQSACAFDIALYNQKHTWCSLMSKEFIRSLEYLDDLQQFYWIGGGYKINYEMAATLLREIFDIMRGREAQNNTLAGIFYFAHAETTLPLMTLMGYGDRSFLAANATQADIASRGFRTSVLSPFAANIETRLFRRKTNRGELYVQILVNEKEAKIPGCDRLFCKLSQLEKQWRYYLTSYDFHRDCE